MADRPSVNMIPQVGVETTKGTPVAATARFTDMNINMDPNWQYQTYRARGYKVLNKIVRHRKSGMGKYDGKLSYGNIIYILCSMFGKPLSVTQIGVTGMYTWTFLPLSQGKDTNLQTYTIELGDDQAAEIYPYCAFNSCSISSPTNDCAVSGDILAQSANLAGTLTALTQSADVDEPLVTADSIDVFLDDTSGGLGTTKITDSVTETLTMPARFKEKFVHNTAKTSFSGLLETAYDGLTLAMDAEYNSQMRAIVSALDTAQSPTKFIRWLATGPTVSSTAYKIQIDMAMKCDKPTSVPELDGSISGYNLNWHLVNDKVWTKAMAITVINKLATL